MKPGDMLPPMSELDAILSTDRLLDETKKLLDANIKPLFDEAIYKKEITNKLKYRQDEVKKLLQKKVKFLDDEKLLI